MNQSITIPKELPQGTAMDFDFLRTEGIKHLQQFSGKLWTDFNLHDPGITILEHLCYAITDLGYRTNFDIEDLLAREEGNSFGEFFSPLEVLTTNPVSLDDYRKVMLDVEGVRNAWIEKELKPLPESYFTTAKQKSVIRYKDPKSGKMLEKEYSVENTHGLFALPTSEQLHLKGLYRILLDIDGNATEVRRRVEERLHSTRNLCEDFAEVKVLEPQMIKVNLTIEINETDDLGTLVQSIFEKTEHYISPCFQFLTLQQMLEKGKDIDEIFDGPALDHGFIENEALTENKKKTALHVSDIINEVMNLSGVKTVTNISLQSDNGKEEFWSLNLDETKVAKLDIKNSIIKLSRNGIAFSVDSESITKTHSNSSHLTIDEAERNIILKESTYNRLSDYYSIQNEFPDNFGLSEGSLSESDLPERKAKTKQLKAYLIFFEQILANYFQQLEHFKDFYSGANSTTKSYYSQALNSVPEAKNIFSSFSKYEKQLDAFAETKSQAIDRRNRTLNHLLARFSEDFTDYSLMLYRQKLPSNELGEKLIRLKSNFLKNYPEISSNRGKAFDYTSGTTMVSGLERRLSYLLDVDPQDENRLFVVEHILLRPVEGDYFQEYGDGVDTKFFSDLKDKNAFTQLNQLMTEVVRKDPYSLQLSVMLPNWEVRAKDVHFRNYVEKVIRQETPAHLVVYIKWLPKETFKAFKSAYSNWVKKLQRK